jgi:hypothetical protein
VLVDAEHNKRTLSFASTYNNKKKHRRIKLKISLHGLTQIAPAEVAQKL